MYLKMQDYICLAIENILNAHVEVQPSVYGFNIYFTSL